MKLAYSTLACPGWTVEEAADAVARYGFDGIEWRLADGEPITSQTPPAVLQRVVEATRGRWLRMPALDSSCLLVQNDEAGRSKSVREGEFMVNLALTLGAPAVRVFGGPLPDGVSIGEALTPAAEVLRRIAQHAAAHDIQILLETHDPAWSPSPHAAALTSSAGVPPVGILSTVRHPAPLGEPPDAP